MTPVAFFSLQYFTPAPSDVEKWPVSSKLGVNFSISVILKWKNTDTLRKDMKKQLELRTGKNNTSKIKGF